MPGMVGNTRALLGAASFLLILSGCGGDDKAAASVDTTAFTVTAAPGEVTPTRTFTLTLDDPNATVSVQPGLTGGIFWVQGIAEGLPPSQRRYVINYAPPGSLPDGTYTTDILVHICKAPDCAERARGSPLRIRSTYQVGGSPAFAASVSQSIVSRTVDTVAASPYVEVDFSISPVPAGGYYAAAIATGNGIDFTSVAQGISAGTRTLRIHFLSPRQQPVGVYNGTITIRVCLDIACGREVIGSPLVVTTQYEVTPPTDTGASPLPSLLGGMALNHDIVDAEYSRTRNEVVMVSRSPVNAIYVYDVATGIERSRALDGVPTAVSLAPDGHAAAVAHAAAVSVVDIPSVGEAGAPAIVRLDVSSDISDLVFDGHGYVHVIPLTDQWESVHSIHVASNTEVLSSPQFVYAGASARLHPAGNLIYTIDRNYIDIWDVTAGRARRLDTRMSTPLLVCGTLWFDQTGGRIFTPCGNVFGAQDLALAGTLQSSSSAGAVWRFYAADHGAAGNEIAALESDHQVCSWNPPDQPCYHRLAIFNSQNFERQALYALGHANVDGTRRDVHGLFVFYAADGVSKILLSKLAGMPDPAAGHYIGLVP